MKRIFFVLFPLAFSLVAAGSGPATPSQPPAAPPTASYPMKIHLELDGTTIAATLDDNAAARDFVAMLPLSLTLKDYASTEKVADLPRRLSTQGAPEGIDPEVGDITYYAPWGNLALFYRDFGYSAGLVKLGRIESGVGALRRPSSMKVTIRRAPD